MSYRSDPHCGGQGVYLKYIARGLAELGQHVEILSGPPAPPSAPDIPVHDMIGLDLYDPADPFRLPRASELADPLHLYEWLNVSTMGFPEPFLFGWRAYRFLRRRLDAFDVVHDNQCLAYGVHAISRRIPTVATIHHPITVDRTLAIRSANRAEEKFRQFRWHSFLSMQRRVARRLPRIITVSDAARSDIERDFGIDRHRFRVVPNGIDTDLFHPLPGTEREPGRILVTSSADTALKGLDVLLDALARVSAEHPVRLVVVGRNRGGKGLRRRLDAMGIADRVTFTGRIGEAELVRQHARAAMVVVPSRYEGFGLPVGEAMACGVPVIATTGGALPEVAGDAGLLVAPGDADALAGAIRRLLREPGLARRLGKAGHRRIHCNFTWRRAAEATLAVYREAVVDHRGS